MQKKTEVNIDVFIAKTDWKYQELFLNNYKGSLWQLHSAYLYEERPFSNSSWHVIQSPSKYACKPFANDWSYDVGSVIYIWMK